MADHSSPRIRITAKRPSFWRAGVEHTSAGQVHEAGTFTAAQLKQLKAESMLVVEELDEEPKKPEPKKPEPAAPDPKKADDKKAEKK